MEELSAAKNATAVATSLTVAAFTKGMFLIASFLNFLSLKK